MPRKLAIPPDALARQNMLKEVCKNPPTGQTMSVEDHKPSSKPPQDAGDAALMTDREDQSRSA